MKKTSVCKICRRMQEKLFLKGERCLSQKCAIIRRNYAPGIHGQKRRRPISEYALQLQEKRKKELKGEENRLDNMVYQQKLAFSIRAAQQLISHGHVLVNNKRVNISSYLTKEKDKIKLKK